MGRRVLVVDDSTSMRMLVQGTLEAHAIEAFATQNGKAALKKLHEAGVVDLIITDLNMPEMKGLEFVAAARKSPWHAIPPFCF